MQPSVSAAVLPAWMRTPLKLGTPSRMGSHALNFGEYVLTPWGHRFGNRYAVSVTAIIP